MEADVWCLLSSILLVSHKSSYYYHYDSYYLKKKITLTLLQPQFDYYFVRKIQKQLSLSPWFVLFLSLILTFSLILIIILMILFLFLLDLLFYFLFFSFPFFFVYFFVLSLRRGFQAAWLSIPTPSHMQGLFCIAATLVREDVVPLTDRLSSEKDSILLPNHFGGFL